MKSGNSLIRTFIVNTINFVPIRLVLRAATITGILPRSIWRKFPVSGKFRIRIDGCDFIYESHPSDSIARILFWKGPKHWEHTSTTLFAHLAKNAQTILDIGANTGIYSLLGLSANRNSKVIAFEPVDQTRKQLARNIANNHWLDRCRIVEKAVSDECAESTFFIPDRDIPTTARLGTAGGMESGARVTIQTITLDDFLEPGDKPDLVKIDVEGHEPNVLHGMRSTIEYCKPAFLLECNPGGPAREITEYLRTFNYNFFALGGGKPVAIAEIPPESTEYSRNYLCLPETKLHWLSDFGIKE
jgi:FkbM family methyltransferase